jgi:hypothetical protein
MPIILLSVGKLTYLGTVLVYLFTCEIIPPDSEEAYCSAVNFSYRTAPPPPSEVNFSYHTAPPPPAPPSAVKINHKTY